MSFASDAQLEIAHLPIEDMECAKSELCAALLGSGGISFQGFGKYRAQLVASDTIIVRRYYTLLKRFFDVIGELRVLKTGQFGGRTRYQLVVPDESVSVLLDQMTLLDSDALFGLRRSPAEEVTRGEERATAFLRAAFLFCGTMSNPEKAYHMEFAAPNEEYAAIVMRLLNGFEVSAKIACRKGKNVVYLKGAEEVMDVLTRLGAHRSVLEMENICIAKELRNKLNRQMNCDAFNIDRVILSAQRQMEDIRFINEELGLDRLPEPLREIARVRMENPQAPLSEIGELLVPPLGKSGVNARLRRIGEIAGKLRSGEEIEI